MHKKKATEERDRIMLTARLMGLGEKMRTDSLNNNLCIAMLSLEVEHPLRRRWFDDVFPFIRVEEE